MPPQPGAPAARVTSVHHRVSLTVRVGECEASLGDPSAGRSAALWEGEGGAMRDPGLVQRAERAAFALEHAWEHWRSQRGLAAEKPTPVSSYVGYSLEEPWGQPRVVFGLGAEEAEMLAAVLDGYDYIGPVHADLSDWRPAAGEQLPAAPAEPEQAVVSAAQPPEVAEGGDREPADEESAEPSQPFEPLIAAGGEHDAVPTEVVALEELVPLPAPETAPSFTSRMSRPRRSQRNGHETGAAWAQQQEHEATATADTSV
jgi:hypothetical protein